MELLNATLKELGKAFGIFQDGDPIVGCWIAGDGHYAFADFRSSEEATQAFVLQQVQIHGQYLKVGRPKNSTGIIPTASQLICGNPNFVPTNLSNSKKKNTSASVVQQALKQGQVIDQTSEVMSSLNTKLEINNFPETHSLDMIQKICEVFGNVKHIDMIKDPLTSQFKGTVHIEFSNEMEAKKAHSSMMGLKIEEQVLFVKKITSISAPTQDGSGEVFKALIEDKPTSCLCLRNLVKLGEIEERIDYKELEYDVQDEMMRYGKCLKVEVPRPPLFGDPESLPAFGKVFVMFTNPEESERAKIALFRRRFNGRVVEVMYYPEEKFRKE